MTAAISILDAMRDPALFGPSFKRRANPAEIADPVKRAPSALISVTPSPG